MTFLGTPRPPLINVIASSALTVLGSVASAFALSPRPAAALIRWVFERDARVTVAKMRQYAPTSGVSHTSNVVYGEPANRARLDVYTPTSEAAAGAPALPTIVWIHGGAWISGYKEDADPYARMLAGRGFTAVSLAYTLAPERRYPTALHQLNSALRYLTDHAAELGIDPTQFVIAGDSAGANLSSQLAALITNADYAASLEVTPGLAPEQLRGVVLNCGIYDVSDIPKATGLEGWGFKAALRAYLGRKSWGGSPGAWEMSTINHVTANFPPTWISGGNGDGLTSTQSMPFAARLKRLGVPVTALFYRHEHEPALPHEYQFHFEYDDAMLAFESTVEFVRGVTTGAVTAATDGE